jgi:hypothetical protein
MCDASPITNALTALLILINLAVSSVAFGIGWLESGTPWGEIVAKVSLGCAIVWIIGAFVAWGFLSNAVSTFCTCAAASKGCTKPCTDMKTPNALFMVGLGLLSLSAIVGEFTSEIYAAIALMFAAIIALGAATFGGIQTTVALGSCQGRG